MDQKKQRQKQGQKRQQPDDIADLVDSSVTKRSNQADSLSHLLCTPQEQTHIQRLYQSQAKRGRNDTALACFMDDTLQDSTLKKRRFVYELLQNADDAGASEIFFRLTTTGFLVISNNGRPFTKEDVDTVCTLCSRDNQKRNDQAKTGYKDIGFKINFMFSDLVYVISGNPEKNTRYSFRFDKQYFSDIEQKADATKEGGKYPWKVIPILNSINDLIHVPKVDARKTNVIIKLRNNEDFQVVKQALSHICEHVEELLFLKSARHLIVLNQSIFVSVVGEVKPQEPTVKKLEIGERKKNESTNKFEVVNKHEHSRWVLFPRYVPISKEMQKSLLDMKERCPAKIRELKELPITYAIKYVNKLPAVEKFSQPLYDTFPTEEKLVLPFLVNTRLILNPLRTEVLPEVWNEFVFGSLAFQQFLVLQWLAKCDEKIRDNVLSFISEDNAVKRKPFNRQFTKGFFRAWREIEFLPSYCDPKKLLSAGQAIIDSKNFFQEIGQNEFTDSKMKERVIMHGLKDQKNLEVHKAKYRVRDYDLSDYLKKIDTPDKAILVLNSLFKMYVEHKLEKFLFSPARLKRILLLTETNQLRPANRCLLPDSYRAQPSAEGMIKKREVFVSVRYLADRNEKGHVEKWRNFLLFIGVKEKIELRKEANYSREDLMRDMGASIEEKYFKYLSGTNNFPLSQEGKTNHKLNKQQFLGFVYVDFMDELLGQDNEYDRLFWAAVDNQWMVLANSRQCSCDKLQNLLNYLHYYLEVETRFKATDGLVHKLSEIFASFSYPTHEDLPKEARGFIENFLPFFPPEISLSDEQKNFLKLDQSFPNKTAAITLLKHAEKMRQLNIGRAQLYRIIYDALTRSSVNEQEQQTLRDPKVLLLSQDNDLVAIPELTYLAGGNGNEGKKEKYLQTPPTITEAQMKKICTIFNLRVKKLLAVSFSLDNVIGVRDIDLEKIVVERLTIFVAHVMYLQGGVGAEYGKVLLAEFYGKLKSLQIWCAKRADLDRVGTVIESRVGLELAKGKNGEAVLSYIKESDFGKKDYYHKGTFYQTGQEIMREMVEYLSTDKLRLSKECFAIFFQKNMEIIKRKFSGQYDEGLFKQLNARLEELKKQSAVLGKQQVLAVVPSVAPIQVPAISVPIQGKIKRHVRETSDPIHKTVVSSVKNGEEKEVKPRELPEAKKLASKLQAHKYQPETDAKGGAKCLSSALPGVVVKGGELLPALASADEKAKKEKENRELGLLGEQCVYHFLRKKYKKKYKVKPTKTERGFCFAAERIDNNKSVEFEIVFFNKGKKVGDQDIDQSHVDLEIHKKVIDDDVQDKKTVRYIEVKTTAGKNKAPTISLSAQEWKFALQHRAAYRLFCVLFNQENPRQSVINIYRDPVTLFFQGTITPVSSLKLKLPAIEATTSSFSSNDPGDKHL
jgi:hypothetical protein